MNNNPEKGIGIRGVFGIHEDLGYRDMQTKWKVQIKSALTRGSFVLGVIEGSNFTKEDSDKVFEDTFKGDLPFDAIRRQVRLTNENGLNQTLFEIGKFSNKRFSLLLERGNSTPNNNSVYESILNKVIVSIGLRKLSEALIYFNQYNSIRGKDSSLRDNDVVSSIVEKVKLMQSKRIDVEKLDISLLFGSAHMGLTSLVSESLRNNNFDINYKREELIRTHQYSNDYPVRVSDDTKDLANLPFYVSFISKLFNNSPLLPQINNMKEIREDTLYDLSGGFLLENPEKVLNYLRLISENGTSGVQMVVKDINENIKRNPKLKKK